MITTYATKISSSTVTCTNDEKTLLLTEAAAMETARARVMSVLATIQEEIQCKGRVQSIRLSKSLDHKVHIGGGRAVRVQTFAEASLMSPYL